MDTVINATPKTPEIIFDNQMSSVLMKGIIIPEDPHEYFSKINPEIRRFYEMNGKINIMFDLDYFNTGSAKYLYELLKIFKGKPDVKITWIYEKDDEDIFETGLEYHKLTGLEFVYKSR